MKREQNLSGVNHEVGQDTLKKAMKKRQFNVESDKDVKNVISRFHTLNLHVKSTTH